MAFMTNLCSIIPIFISIHLAAGQTNPTFLDPDPSGSTVPIDETSPIGTSVYTLDATDADVGDTLTYAITIQNPHTYFTVSGGTGIFTTTALDFETDPVYELTVSVTDSTSNVVSGTLTVSLIDINDEAPVVTVNPGTVAENEATGTIVAGVINSVTDGDAGDTHTYSLSGTLFHWVAMMSLATAVADGTTSVTEDLIVNFQDEIDEAPVITVPGTPPSLDEGQSIGTVVTGVFTEADKDAGDTRSYVLSGTDTTYFQIDSGTGLVSTAQVLDYEAGRTTFDQLTLTVEDLAGNSDTKSLSITLNDVSDELPIFDPSIYFVSIDEASGAGESVALLAVTDNDDGDTITLTITSGDDASAKFVIVNKEIQTTSTAIDYENLSSQDYKYTLLVEATDGTTTPSTATVVVSINAVDDNPLTWGTFNPPWVDAGTPVDTISEDVSIGTTVVSIVATDADEGIGGTVSYSLVSVTPNGGGLFNIDSSTGALFTIGSLDRDTASGGTDYFDINVKALTDGGDQINRIVRVALSDVNEFTPQFSQSVYTVTSVTESTTAGTNLLTFAATDSDETSTFTYSITAGNTGGYFTTSTADLNLATAVDLESGGSTLYQLTVTVSDGGSPAKVGTAIVLVTVASVNDNDPVFVSSTPASPSFAENTAVGTSVATVSFTDADVGGDDGTLTFSITSGNINNDFQIDAASGVVTLAKALNFEGTPSYNLEVTATDGGTPARAVATTFNVTVNDVSDNAPTCTPGSVTATANENLNVADTVTALTCSDVDTGDTISYGIASGNTDLTFDISTAGVITVAKALDYESATQDYSLVITVSDGSNSLSVPVTIALGAVNEDTPAFGSNPTVSIAETKSVGDVITTYAATDSDSSPHAITTYTINSVTNSGTNVFNIEESTGKITLASPVDYESLPAGVKNYEIEVFATDGGGLQGTGTVTVSVTDANDNTPSCSPGAHSISVDENSAGNTVLIADLACSDADVDDGTTLSYTIPTQSPGTNFALTGTNALEIAASGSLDYETNEQHEVEIEVTDGTYSMTVKVSIAVNDLNEVGPTFSGAVAASISESAAVGASVADVTATDPDLSTTDNGRLLYSITGGDTLKQFIINPDTGRVSVAAPLDAQSYTLTIQAIEAIKTNSNTNTLTVTVTDENDSSPVCNPATFTATFPENTAATTAITTLTCTDYDSTSTLTYTITTGDTSNFEMNTGTPETLQFKTAIDYDAGTSKFDLIITVSDGTHSVNVPVTVTITDVNEHTPAFTGDPYSVAHDEDYAIGNLITTVAATDDDQDDTVTYAFSATYPQFTIDSNSGQVLLAAPLDRESPGTHTLSVIATDGTNQVTGTIRVTVNDVNDNAPSFSPDKYSKDISESDAAGTAVVTVVATDSDDPSTNNNGVINYVITDGNTNSDFVIDQSTGAITTANQLDYERTTTYTLTVEAVDRTGAGSASSLTGTAVVVVTVNNVNEANPTFSQNTYSVSVSETEAVGFSLAQVTATDDDSGVDGEFTYSMVTQGNFYLKGDTGVVTLKALLDYETAKSHSFEVVVTDKGTPAKSATATVTVTVTDENDNMPSCSPSLYTGTFAENTATATSLAQLTCSDDDDSSPNSDISYTIVSVNGAAGTSPFRIGPTTGQVTLDSAFDYESTSSYDVLIDVVDGGISALSTTATVNIQVSDVNEAAPVFTAAPYSANVAETASIGHTAIVVAATDTDTADSTVYSLNPISTDFSIDPGTGEIIVTATLDSEGKPSYNLTVFATDTGNPAQSVSTSITLTVTNTNDAVPVFNPGVYTIDMGEDTTAGTTVVSVTATDADSTSIIYTINGGNTDNIFGINIDASSICHVTVVDVSNLNYEAITSYQLVIHADDQGGQTATTTVMVQITGHNEHTPAFTLGSSANRDVAEDSAVGTTILDLNANDADDGVDGMITYSILSGDLGKFAIGPSTGVVTTSGDLDMETVTSYTMEIQAIDAGVSGGQLSSTFTLTVSVTDVNDNTPNCTSSQYTATVAEDTATTTSIALIDCSDSDNDPAGLNNALTYLVTSGNTGGAFAIASNGEVTVDAALDRETTPSYLLVIDVADTSTATKLTTTTSLTIVITDINDNDPLFTLATYATTQAESVVIGSTVTTVAATDADEGDNGVIVYSITSGNDAGKFEIDSSTGDVLVVAALDYENATSYSLTVQAEDKGTTPRTDSAVVEVTVNDENDNNPLCTNNLYSATITESALTSTNILTVACTDEDSISSITYSITAGNTAIAFLVNPTTGEISNLITLDAETVPLYTLTVQASDGTLTSDVTVKISVVDENDNSPAFNPAGPYTVNVDEDIGIGTSVFNIDATDADITTTDFVFTITNGNIGSAFLIDSSTGVIQLHQTLDREPLSSYTLSIEVSDGTNPAVGTTLRVTVLDKNDNFPNCTDWYSKTVSETATFPQTEDISCTDADESPVLSYTIASGNGERRFSVDPTTGLISINSLEYETTTEYTLTVEVTDGGTDPFELTTTITYIVYVSASNEGTPTFTVPAGGYAATVSEGAILNNAVITVVATDTDSGGADHGTITYSITGGDDNSQFYISPTTGDITVGGALDRETEASYKLTVEASDMSSGAADQLKSTASVSITISDINDNRPTFNPVTYSTSVLEDAGVSTTVLQVTATDLDDGVAGTAGLQYSITGGNTGTAFSFLGDEIVLIAPIDKETVSQYQLTIEVADQGTNPGALTATTTVVIDVTAVNEHSPLFSDPSPQTRTIGEDTALATTVYTAGATDLDTGDFGVLRYVISGGNTNDDFLINEFTGDVLVWKTLDYDTAPTSYDLIIEARDNAGQTSADTLTATLTLTVALTDVNDHTPTATQNTYTGTLAEDATASTSVVTVVATDSDSDLPNSNFAFSILSGDGTSVFTIDASTGEVSTTAALDFETKSLYYLVIQALDTGTTPSALSSTVLVTITVTDVNDETPEFAVKNFATTIAEDVSQSTSVTTVAAIDADSVLNNNNIFTYTIPAGTGTFKVDATTGEVSTNAVLDREITASYVIEVEAADQGGPPGPNTGTSTITIIITDVNDNTPAITGTYDASFAEDTALNTIVHAIAATDDDEGENAQLTYTIQSGNTNSDFVIDSGSGRIQVGNALDFETTQVYTLEVVVSDNGATPNSATVTATVSVTDVNDNAPTVSTSPYTFAIDENVATSTSVGTIVGSDLDSGVNAALTYSIAFFTTGDSGHFIIDSSTGDITTNDNIDRETIDSYVLTARVSDGGTPTLTSTVTVSITINDLNDNTPAFDSPSYSVVMTENTALTTSLMQVVITDPDLGVNSQITLSLDSAPATTYFAIDSTTSILSVLTNVDRETIDNFSFYILATDGGTPPLSSSASVTVTVQDENDNNPVFSPIFYNSEIAYNDDCQNTVADLTATDADIGVNADFTFSFSQNDNPTIFSIDGTTGIVSQIATSAADTKYLMYGDATDGGTPANSAVTTATIRVDTYNPDDVIVNWYMDISKSSYEAAESTFLSQLTAVYQTTYPTAQAKRWCVDEPTSTTSIVYIYVIKDDLADAIDEISNSKSFLTSTEAFNEVSADSSGTPGSAITGTAWDPFRITKVEKHYIAPAEDTSQLWIETAVGITVVSIISAIALVVIILITAGAIHYWRKGKRSMSLDRPIMRDAEGGPRRTRYQNPRNGNEDKLIDKAHPPPAVVALPMPAARPQMIKPEANKPFGKPNVKSLYSNSQPNSSDVKQEKDTDTLTRKRKMPPPPTQKPQNRVSPHLNESRSVRGQTESGDGGSSYIVLNRRFDGRARDPGTGNLYEYDTKNGVRRWVTTPDGKEVKAEGQDWD